MTRARRAVFAYHTIGARALEALVARGEDVALVATHVDDPAESARYRQPLGPELLALPRVAALNRPGSLLPAYRGRAPLNWVLVNGERLRPGARL